MRIPKRFQLLGRTIEIKMNPKLVQDRNWNGCASYDEGLIELVPLSESYDAAVTKFEQTFCHEFAHWLLYFAGAGINYNMKDGGYIHQNEEFVDLLGGIIHQALNTMEYDD